VKSLTHFDFVEFEGKNFIASGEKMSSTNAREFEKIASDLKN